MSELNQLSELVLGLEGLGYEVVDRLGSSEECTELVLRNVEHEHTYVLTSSGGWIQAAHVLFEATEIEQSGSASAAVLLAFRVNGRFLGCRFAFDEYMNLVVLYDVYPNTSAEHVALALGQMYYVASRTYPLLEQALAGKAIEDEQIDFAFVEPGDVEGD